MRAEFVVGLELDRGGQRSSRSFHEGWLCVKSSEVIFQISSSVVISIPPLDPTSGGESWCCQVGRGKRMEERRGEENGIDGESWMMRANVEEGEYE